MSPDFSMKSVPGRPAHRVPWFNLAGGLEHWVGQNHAGDVTSYDMWPETDAREAGHEKKIILNSSIFF